MWSGVGLIILFLFSRLRHFLRNPLPVHPAITSTGKRKRNLEKEEPVKKRAESFNEGAESDSSYETNDEFISEEEEEESQTDHIYYSGGLLSTIGQQTNKQKTCKQPTIKLTFSIEEEEEEEEEERLGDCVIDLTHSSSDTSDHQLTPAASVIIISDDTTNGSLEATSTRSTGGGSVSPVIRGGSPLVVLSSSSEASCNGRGASPSVVPLSPSKEPVDSILFKRKDSFF